MNIFSNWMSKKISRRIAFSTVILALSFILAIATASFFYTRSILEKQLLADLSNQAILASRIFSANLYSQAAAIRGLSKSPLIINALVDSSERDAYLKPFIRSYQIGDSRISKLVLTDFSGKPIAAKGTATNFERSLWKRSVIELNQVYASVERAKGAAIALIAFPVIFPITGLPEGMLVAELDLRQMFRQMTDQFTATSHLKLVQNGITLIDGSNAFSAETPTLTARQSVTENDPFKSLNLEIVVSESVENATAPLRSLVNYYVLIGGVALITVLLISQGVASRLTSPIVMLSRFAQQVADSETPEHELSWRGRDEVGILADTLGKMLAKLRAARDNLEYKVNERTRDLQFTLSQLNALIANNPAGIIFEQPSGRIELVNEKIRELLEVPEIPELLNSTSSENFSEIFSRQLKDYNHYLDLTTQLRAQRISISGEEIETISGVTLELDYVPIWEGDHFLGHLWIFRDISERKKIERLKSEFVSVVSHELRTPITSIRGALNLLAAGVGGTLQPETKNLIDIAARNSERLTMIVNDILDMDRIASGRMPFEIKQHSVVALITQAIQNAKHYGERYDVIFLANESSVDGFINVDHSRFQQVMDNLLSNAAKFSPAQSHVDIEATQSGKFIRISVRDQGSGIPEEFHDRIFQKFSQADATDTRAKGGSGLGLAISKAIVEKMGGQINFESQPGKGSTFFIIFPVS